MYFVLIIGQIIRITVFRWSLKCPFIISVSWSNKVGITRIRHTGTFIDVLGLENFQANLGTSASPNSIGNPTDPITSLEPQRPSVDLLELNTICRSPDFETLKMWEDQPGMKPPSLVMEGCRKENDFIASRSTPFVASLIKPATPILSPDLLTDRSGLYLTSPFTTLEL